MNIKKTQSAACRGVAAVLVVAATACSGQPQAVPATTAAAPSAADTPIPDTASPFDALPEGVRLAMDKPFTGDFDALVKRRSIRVGVTFNRTHYFIDKGQERGLTYESLKLFEQDLNADLKTGNLKVHVVIVPMTRTQLYPALASGKIDMVAAMVTIRPELEKLVAFSAPTRTNVNEVVVTGPGAPPITTVDDLAGQEVFVRKGSIYEESLVRLNEQLKARGKPAVVIDEAPDVLEDDDVLEMVNAGLAPITIVDDYLAEFWSKVFTSIKVHSDIAVRSGGSLAVAFRKENPRLRETVDTWLRKHAKGDAFRNTIERRYLDSGEKDLQKLQEQLQTELRPELISYIIAVRTAGKTFNSVMNLIPAPPKEEAQEEPEEEQQDPTTTQPQQDEATSQPGDENPASQPARSSDQHATRGRSEKKPTTSQPAFENLTPDLPPATYEDLPVILDRLTTNAAPVMAGRINVSTAGLPVLATLTELKDDEVMAIADARRQLAPEDLATPAWVLMSGAINENRFRQILPKITTSSSAFKIDSVGYGDHTGAVERISVVLEMRGPVAQVRYYRSLSGLGTAYTPHVLEQRGGLSQRAP